MNFQKFKIISVLIGISLSTGAEARRHSHHRFRCAHGQIYRVSMGVCESRYARYETAPKPERRPRHQKPVMLQVVEPPAKAQDALLEAAQPERTSKGDCAATGSGVILPNVPWYSAERSLMTIKPIGGFSWIIH